MLPVRITPVDRLLFAGDVAAIGSFRCPASHPLFRDSGPAGSHLFVFPRSATFIRHEGGEKFLADTNTVSLYNRNQEYERTKASDMDASDWFAVAGDVALEAVSARDPRILDRADRPFRFSHAPSSTALYARQRRLFEHVSAGGPLDRLQVEESVMALLHDLIAWLYQVEATAAHHRSVRDQVEATRQLIASHPDRQLGLLQLSDAVGCSPFTLCRAFRAIIGATVTGYRHAIRMNKSLELLRSPDDLTNIALDLGYSSHSHFTMVFHRTFGMTPSEFRDSRGWSTITLEAVGRPTGTSTQTPR
jgi:AraC family transcriptional regulator